MFPLAEKPLASPPTTSNKELEKLCYILIDEVLSRHERGDKTAKDLLNIIFQRLRCETSQR